VSPGIGHARDDAAAGAESLRLSRRLAHAAEAELRIVRRMSTASRWPAVRTCVVVINTLGDGWIYALAALAVVARMGLAGGRVIATALAAAAGSHLIYAFVKRRTKRLRPFERDASIESVARILDRYSFPSGHCMTVTAVAVPIIAAIPPWRPAAVITFVLVALCRLLAGHHYPSDLAAGALIGLLVSVPVVLLVR
jgi:undecaprenyl-diphosphatase